LSSKVEASVIVALRISLGVCQWRDSEYRSTFTKLWPKSSVSLSFFWTWCTWL